MANNEDLFAGLVKPNDMYSDGNGMNSQCVLPTEQPNNEHGVNNYGSSSNQHDDDQSMECCPSSLSTGNDAFTVPFNVLERVAKRMLFLFMMYHMMVIVYSAAQHTSLSLLQHAE